MTIGGRYIKDKEKEKDISINQGTRGSCDLGVEDLCTIV